MSSTKLRIASSCKQRLCHPCAGSRSWAVLAAGGIVLAAIFLGLSPALAQSNTPGVPQNLIAAHEGGDRINVGWDAPASDGGSAVTGYKVEVSADNSTFTVLTASTTDTHDTHTNLSEGDTRYYRVSATNANGTGSASCCSQCHHRRRQRGSARSDDLQSDLRRSRHGHHRRQHEHRAGHRHIDGVAD